MTKQIETKQNIETSVLNESEKNLLEKVKSSEIKNLQELYDTIKLANKISSNLYRLE
jgi:hypothetical protein